MQLSNESTVAIPVNKAEANFASGFGSQASTENNAPFSDFFSDAVGQISKLEDNARTTVDRLITGSGADIHEAMIATQKVSMAFELALAVRNKAVQAYQSVMAMQF